VLGAVPSLPASALLALASVVCTLLSNASRFPFSAAENVYARYRSRIHIS
jgi:hypothetical protein